MTQHLTITLDIELPDSADLREREIVAAMEAGLASAVIRAWESSLPADHVAWTTKFRALSDEQRIELSRKRKALRRETAVTVLSQ